MVEIKLADAKARLSELVDRIEKGDEVEITRRGKAVARLTTIKRPRKKIRLDELQAAVANMPLQKQNATDLVRSMRDEDRY